MVVVARAQTFPRHPFNSYSNSYSRSDISWMVAVSITVAIANPKGGVGKSLTTMMLADGLALSYGARILVLDVDPQAGVTKSLLGIDAEQELHERRIGLG